MRFIPIVNTMFCFIKRDFILTVTYKTAFIAQILTVLIAVTAFYYIGEVTNGVTHPSMKAYENNYFAFLLIGVALIDYMLVSLTIFNANIRENQMMGTLEILLLSPIRVSYILLFSSLWAYIFTTFRFLLFLTFSTFIFDLDIGKANIVSALVVLILSVLCFIPLGIISATTVVLFKKGDWFKMLLSGLSFLFSGVAYPVSVLPAWLASLAFYIPMTHSLHGMRQALLRGDTLRDLGPEIAFLLVFSIVAMPLSLLSFRFALNRTKQTGSLPHY